MICIQNTFHQTKHTTRNEATNEAGRQGEMGRGRVTEDEAVAEAEAEAGIELAWTNKHVKYFRVAAACSK